MCGLSFGQNAPHHRPRVVHLVPRDGIGGVEVAANSMLGVEKSIDFYLVFITGGLMLREVGIGEVLGGSDRHSLNPLAHIRGLANVVKLKPDIIVCSLWKSIPIALVSMRLLLGCKLVAFYHSASPAHRLDKIFHSLLLGQCDAVWADSTATLNQRVSIRGVKPQRVISFVTNGAPKVVTLGKVKANFVFWGRLHRLKGIDRALKFIRELRLNGIDANFDVIGPDDGELRALKAVAAAYGIAGYVNFLGAADADEIAQIAAASSFYLQLSRDEGMAMSVVEAMQMGLVPIVTPVGEIGTYCREHNAIIVDSVNDFSGPIARVQEMLAVPENYNLARDSAVSSWKSQPVYRDDFCAAAIELVTV